MNTTNDTHTDGMTGLAILLLMTIAFVAGEVHRGLEFKPTPELSGRTPDAGILIDLAPLPSNEDAAIGGAIRELRVIPALIESQLDLGWSSDEAVIEEFRQNGF